MPVSPFPRPAWARSRTREDDVRQDTMDRGPILQEHVVTAARAEPGKLSGRVTPVGVYLCVASVAIGTYYLLPKAGVAQAALFVLINAVAMFAAWRAASRAG